MSVYVVIAAVSPSFFFLTAPPKGLFRRVCRRATTSTSGGGQPHDSAVGMALDDSKVGKPVVQRSTSRAHPGTFACSTETREDCLAAVIVISMCTYAEELAAIKLK